MSRSAFTPPSNRGFEYSLPKLQSPKWNSGGHEIRGGNQLGSYCDFFHFFLFYIRWFTATYCDKLSTERNRNDLRGAELFTQYYQMCVLNMIQIFNNTDIYVFINPDASLSSCRFLFGWKPTRISLTSFFSIYTSWSVCWVDRRLSAHVGW